MNATTQTNAPSKIPEAIRAVLDRHGLKMWQVSVPRVGVIECWLVRGRDTVYITRYSDGHGIATHAPFGGNSVADTAAAIDHETWQSATKEDPK